MISARSSGVGTIGSTNSALRQLVTPANNTTSDSHRMAAYHFKQAAMQHELAADAYDLGDIDKRDMHAFTAYRHQINAIQFAEISVMLVQGSDEVEDYQ